MNYMALELGIWEITVLALLREAPLHPYQMQRLLRFRHKDEILVLKRGSLYHAIRRLLRTDLIAIEATGRQGNRPERTTYSLTPAGLQEFKGALRKILAAPHREPSDFMAAVSFLVHIDPKEAVPLLNQRVQVLDTEIEQRSAGLVAASCHVQRINLIESEYLVAMLKAERAWTSSLENEVREGKLSWSFKTILRDAAASRTHAGKAKRGDKS